MEEGEVFGLLGPNGAGKTTTFKILTTLLTPSSGKVSIMNENILNNAKSIRNEINFVFGGERGVYNSLTAYEYLSYFCILYKIPSKIYKNKISELLNLVVLNDASDQKISTFSKGMIQRLHIARALINNPKILFLDEPTIGLDPLGSKMLRDIIRNLSKQKITIILTTHYMFEAEELCDKIAFIKKGKFIEYGNKFDILNKYNELNLYQTIISVTNSNSLTESNKFDVVEIKEINDSYYFIEIKAKNEMYESELKKELSKYGVILEFKKKNISLEDIYIELMKVDEINECN